MIIQICKQGPKKRNEKEALDPGEEIFLVKNTRSPITNVSIGLLNVVSSLLCIVDYRFALNHVDEVFSFTSKVKFYGASFRGRKEGICSKSVRMNNTVGMRYM